jgi:DNA-binding response OmpR family regulator
VSLLRSLGATVRTIDLWDDPSAICPADDEMLRAIVVEAMDRPDLAAAALRALRREPLLNQVGAIFAVTAARAGQLNPELGFDDFVLVPYVAPELYARIRHVEWRKSDFSNEERIKIGNVVIDRSGHAVFVDGHAIKLTAREFSLLLHLAEQRGRVVSRDDALERVWGEAYEGGARTVDIHIRRLRQKLGAAFPLITLRGFGYKLMSADEGEAQR